MRIKLLALLLALPFALSAQEFRGTISGTVSDPAGAVVAGAKITATEVSTGSKSQSVSNSDGLYSMPSLSPGVYTVTAELPGFKRYSREKVLLGSGEHPSIDIRLEVGDVATTVNVTSESPLLNSENASVGGVITTKQVEDLPLNGRTPTVLASLSIGVIATGQPSLIHPFDAGAASGFSIAGSFAQTNEIQINGSPDSTWDGRLAYSPPLDAVREVHVDAFNADAAYGHTGGGTINMVTKSGTNSLHGSAWEFNKPNTLGANNFFNNQKGVPNSVTHFNQYGLTVGGPMYIPKLYDGRNKLFWFFAWEGLQDSQPNSTPLTVPTDAERKGDFSALLALGSKYQLYNPFTATMTGTTITRSPFSGNVLPGNLINPIAQAYLKYFPEPNVTGQADGTNNFLSTAPTPDNYNNYLGRADYNVRDRDHIFFDVRHTDYIQSKNNYYGNVSTGSLLTRANWGGSIDNVFTVNPTNVFDLRLNFTRLYESHPAPSFGFDPASLGFPASLAANSNFLQLPTIGFASATGLTTLGSNGGANILPSQSLQLFATWNMIKGRHSFKFGVDARQYNANFSTSGNSTGNFSFSANTWVRSTSTASSTVVQGQDFAEFLLGTPTSGSYDLNTSAALYEHYFGGFLQDDWRIRPNLTINLGIRFDKDLPYYEKDGRTVNGFDGNATSPLNAAAQAAYAKSPNALLPASQFNVMGGLTYPGDGAVYNQTSHLFSPRVGFAWTPDLLKGKTVVRGGFAMFVQPNTISQLTITGAYSTNPILNQQGFSQTTQMVVTNNNNLSPATTLSNPFPSGFKGPTGSSLGLSTFVGQTVSYIPDQSDPYTLRWNFGFEHQLAKDLKLEVEYLGMHALHLPIYTTEQNGIPRKYLSTMPVRDTTLIATLNASTANPFQGLLPNSSNQNGATISVAQLLAKYPQYPVGSGSGSTGVFAYNQTAGSSFFESLNISLTRRFSGGLSVIANFIHSKLIEQDTYLNDTDLTPERRISPYDHPNRIVFAVVYELPVGRGRHFNGQSRWLDAIVGGWNINSIYQYQTGAPATWTNGSTTSPGDYVLANGTNNLDLSTIAFNNRSANLNAAGATIPSFTTSAFVTASTSAFQYHIRTFPTTFSSVRLDGINEWSPSISKQFNFTESIGLQLRLESYNVLNHPVFGPPNTTATNAAFGAITTQANVPRTLQLGARFVF